MSSMGQAPPTVPTRAAPHRTDRVRRSRWARALITLLAATAAVPLNVGVAWAATVDTNAWYVLVNRNSGKALDVSGASTADGAAVLQWSRHDGANQQWQFADSGNGYYRLKSKNSGKVLDIGNWSTADGAKVQQ